MRIAAVLALLTYWGGCAAVNPTPAPATIQIRLLSGRAGVLRVEVHITPLQYLHTATLRLRANGWRVQPNHYTLRALQPPTYSPRNDPGGPYGRPRSILRTFLLEPLAHAAAGSAMLELQTPDGSIHKIIALNHH